MSHCTVSAEPLEHPRRAVAIDWDPPAAMGHPTMWPSPPSMRPNPAVPRDSSGSTECAARPAKRPPASSVTNLRRSRRRADWIASTPNRARVIGCRGGTASGRQEPVGELEPGPHERAEELAVGRGVGSQRGRGVLDRAVQQRDTAVVEGVGQRHVGMHPRQPVLAQRQRTKGR